MASKINQEISTGVAIIYREHKGKKQFLIVKTNEAADWEFPKVPVRKGESSVRAVIRMTGEQIGISTRVLEEAGRYSVSVNMNGKVVTQKHYYYLVMLRAEGGEAIGFNEVSWQDYAQVTKKLKDKKEKKIFQDSKNILKEWEKTKKDRIDQEEEELLALKQEEEEANNK